MRRIALLLFFLVPSSSSHAVIVIRETPLVVAMRTSDFQALDSLIAGDAINRFDENNLAPIHLAVYLGKLDVVKYLETRGADPFLKTGYHGINSYLTPLQIALEEKHNSIALYYIEKGRDLDVPDFLHNYPIHWALLRSSHEVVRALLKRKVSIKVKTYVGGDPLHRAVRSGDLEKVKMIHRAGADINARTVFGITPLHYAVLYDNKDIAGYLLDNGAAVDAKDINGSQPIHRMRFDDSLAKRLFVRNEHAGAGPSADHSILDLLISKGADWYALDASLTTPLHVAAAGNLPSLVMLLSARQAVDARTINGRTPLQYAAMNNRYEAVQLLVNAGADINGGDNEGKTPLMLAFEHEAGSELIAYLLLQGASPRSRDKQGLDVMHYALQSGASPDMIEYLGSEGGFQTAGNDLGLTYLHSAMIGNTTDVVRALIAHSRDQINRKDSSGNTPLFYAIKNNNRVLADLCIRHGADIQVVNNEGESLVHWAARYGKRDMINHIIDRHGDPLSKNGRGETFLHYLFMTGHDFDGDYFVEKRLMPKDASALDAASYLQYAVRGGSIPAIKRLLRRGASINHPDSFGRYPITYSFRHDDQRSKELFETLVAHGADLTVTDTTGSTLLHFAAEGRNLHLVDVLLDRGLDSNAINARGETPLSCAVKAMNVDMVAYLCYRGAQVEGKRYTSYLESMDHAKEDYYTIRNILDRNMKK